MSCYSFETIQELSEFLQANLDKTYKIKTKFSYKDDMPEVVKYKVTEIAKKKEMKTFTVSRFFDNMYGDWHHKVEELPEPSLQTAYILNIVQPYGTGHTVNVKAYGEDQAIYLGNELIDFMLAESDSELKEKKTFRIEKTLETGLFEIEEISELSFEHQYLLNKGWQKNYPKKDVIMTYVKAYNKEDALVIGEEIIDDCQAEWEKEKKVFSVSILVPNYGNYKVNELPSGEDYFLNQVVETYPGMEVKVETYYKEEAILISKSLFEHYRLFDSLSDIEAAFTVLKNKSLNSSVGVGKPYWTRLFHGKDILELAKSFYDSNWGYRQKLDKIKDLKNIKVSGMFLTDKFLSVTILADIEKG